MWPEGHSTLRGSSYTSVPRGQRTLVYNDRGSSDQFLHLSEMAFTGVMNEEVILHAIPPNLTHFDFLDATPSLYGGGGVSYNFLHLTVQEFFAAYYWGSFYTPTLSETHWPTVALDTVEHTYTLALGPRALG